jgi:hypothetical protein
MTSIGRRCVPQGSVALGTGRAHTGILMAVSTHLLPHLENGSQQLSTGFLLQAADE